MMMMVPDPLHVLLDAQLIVDSYYLSRALFAKCKLISRGCVQACREKKEPGG